MGEQDVIGLYAVYFPGLDTTPTEGCLVGTPLVLLTKQRVHVALCPFRSSPAIPRWGEYRGGKGKFRNMFLHSFLVFFWNLTSQNLLLWIQYRPPSLMKTDSVPVTSLSSVGPSLEGLNAEQACFNCNYWKLLINILWNKNIMLKTLNFMCN